jgi:hypothetical protein
VALAHPEITLSVRAEPDIAATSNQHLWRSVRVSGRTDLRAYLSSLYQALPSMTLITDEPTDAPCGSMVVAEMAGVDHEGQPFEVVARLCLGGDEDTIRTVNADVLHVDVGPDLLSRPDGDQRRYFQYLLQGTPEPMADDIGPA